LDLEFNDFLKDIKSNFTNKGWTTLYSNIKQEREGDNITIYSGIVDNDSVTEELENYSWGITLGNGKPDVIFYYEGDVEKWEYDRFSGAKVEPLIIYRDFPGISDVTLELSEEFRLYFNLFEKRKDEEDIFYWIDNNGEYHEVVKISSSNAIVKTKFLKHYLSIRKSKLFIYFDCMKFSEKTLSELSLSEKSNTQTSENMIYNHLIKDISSMPIWNAHTQSWLMGKIYIDSIKNFKPDSFNNYFEQECYEDFLIGYDEDGNEKYFTCEENKLSNNFGANEGASNYLTPVYFNQDVLKKYYDSPHKYTVEDGHIRFNGFWVLRLDNNCDEFIMVFLGDLGHIPYKEQKYWKSFNISPKEGMSLTNFRRAILGEWAEPDNAEHFFKQKYETFNKKWFDKYKWYIFKPLLDGDSHYLTSLHLPLPENAKEFEEQILAITKIIIDSINEKELAKHITEIPDGAKGIKKLGMFIEQKTDKTFNSMIVFLQMLQTLRSTSVAHRKSSKTNKKISKYFSLDEKNYYEIFNDILVKTIWIFNTLESEFLEK